MEKVLLEKEQVVYIQKIRDLVVETLIEEIKAYITLNVHADIEEFYYDCNLDAQSGMFLLIDATERKVRNHPFKNQTLLHKEVEEVTQQAEKNLRASFLIS